MKRISNIEDYCAVKRRFDAVTTSRLERARAVINAAGCEMGCHHHNALVSLDRGKPWPEIDYKLARKGEWMLSRQYLGRDVLDRAYIKALFREYYEGRLNSYESLVGRQYKAITNASCD